MLVMVVQSLKYAVEGTSLSELLKFKMSVKNCTSKEKKYVPRPPQKNKGVSF